MNLIPLTQRAYIASHPLAISFAVGVFITGVTSLIAPHLFEQSSATLALPEWLRVVFRITWTLGGGLSTYGILRGKRPAEAAGMILLSGGFAVNYIAIVSVLTQAALTAVFIATLAVGCGFRARHLLRGGYDLVELRRHGR